MAESDNADLAPLSELLHEAEIVTPCLPKQFEQQARYPRWRFAAAMLLHAASSGHMDTS